MHAFERILRRSLALAVSVAFALTAPADEARRVALSTATVEFRLDPATGAWEALDRAGGVTWRSNPLHARFGEVELEVEGQPRRIPLAACRASETAHALALAFTPQPDKPALEIRVWIRAGADARSLDFAYEAAPGLAVRSVRLLDQAFGVADVEQGGVVVPVRQGLFIPAGSGRAFQHTFDTYNYEGCHMAMLGVVKAGAAVLVHWRDPYVAVEVRSMAANGTGPSGGHLVAPSLVLRNSARRFSVQFLGRGDHVTIGTAYREVAQREGWRVPWSAKLAGHPARAKLFGASNYKLWSVLDRRMNEDSSREERVTVNWTFDEAAQVAEHLKRDLELDRVLFLMGGWIHRGYDNQHPDILPAAPECGGDAGFADCARRIRALGYVLGLHDNYQDIYRDSPSWDERLIMKRADGSLAAGGHWAGGRAFLTCAQRAVDLARRPQNLPAVRKLTGADAYFIDTTYAAGLQECFDPQHPLTRHDDLHWKQVISDDARAEFGIFGSECGREWAIPHSDFFEGLTGVSGRHYHDQGLEAKVGGVVVPLFEIVYRDCIAMYGKYGYDVRQAAGYVLDHILVGRPLHYHNVPPHLYWMGPAVEAEDVSPAIGRFEAAEAGRFRLDYQWHVRRAPAQDWRVFVHLTTPDGRIVQQGDHAPATPATRWPPGTVMTGTSSHEWPAGLTGVLEVRMGLFDPATGRRALLGGIDDDDERQPIVARLRLEGGRVHCEAVAPPPLPGPGAGAFVNARGGWAEGLHPFDRFVKNTHEVLSPLNELTAQVPLTGHEFLTADRKVQRTVFGSGREEVRVTVNAGNAAFAVKSPGGGAVELPPNGFLVESPQFIAFHSATWNGHRYTEPALFTLRSRDGKPIARSAQVRVFHGWGEPEIRIGGGEFNVPREAVVDVARGN